MPTAIRDVGPHAVDEVQPVVPAASEGAGAENEPHQHGRGGHAELTPEEQAAVAKLRARDAEVRAHEAAHAAAGGAMAGSPGSPHRVGPHPAHDHEPGQPCPICAAKIRRYHANTPEGVMPREHRATVVAGLAPSDATSSGTGSVA